MKRRDVLKAIGATAVVGTTAGAAVAAKPEGPLSPADLAALRKQVDENALPLSLRTVFKIVVTDDEPPFKHIRVGSDEWAPTTDEIQKIADAFKAAQSDPIGHIVTPHYVDIAQAPRFIMVKCEFSDLKTSDLFVLYEATGELVVSTNDRFNPVYDITSEYSVSVCSEDAKLNHGVWGVQCAPVVDRLFKLPTECPA